MAKPAKAAFVFIPKPSFASVFGKEGAEYTAKLAAKYGKVENFPPELQQYYRKFGSSYTLVMPPGGEDAGRAVLQALESAAKEVVAAQNIARAAQPLTDTHRQAEQAEIAAGDRSAWFRQLPAERESRAGGRLRQESAYDEGRALSELNSPREVSGEVSRLRRNGRAVDALALLKTGAGKFPDDKILHSMLGNAPDEQELELHGIGRKVEELVRGKKYDAALKLLKDAYSQNQGEAWLGRLLLRTHSDRLKEFAGEEDGGFGLTGLVASKAVKEMEQDLAIMRRNGAMDERAYADALFGYLHFMNSATMDWLGRRSRSKASREFLQPMLDLFDEAKLLDMAGAGAYRAMIGIYNRAQWSDAKILLENEAKAKGFIHWEPEKTSEQVLKEKADRIQRKKEDAEYEARQSREMAHASIAHSCMEIMDETLDVSWFELTLHGLEMRLKSRDTPYELKAKIREALPKLRNMIAHRSEYEARERAALVGKLNAVLAGKKEYLSFTEEFAMERALKGEKGGDAEIADLARKVKAHREEANKQRHIEYEQKARAQFVEMCEKLISGEAEMDYFTKRKLEEYEDDGDTDMAALVKRTQEALELREQEKERAKKEEARAKLVAECKSFIAGEVADHNRSYVQHYGLASELERARKEGDDELIGLITQAQAKLEELQTAQRRNMLVGECNRVLENERRREHYYEWEYDPLRRRLQEYEKLGDMEMVQLIRSALDKMEAGEGGKELRKAYDKAHVTKPRR
jgi:hypothetical protein